MMKLNNIKMLLLVAGVGVTTSLVSCSDKLDEVPDNRTEIDTPEKVSQLLTSGYPLSSPAVICELSGDNLVDDNIVVPATHNDPYAVFHDEAYKWGDIKNYGTGEDDTPYTVWETYFQGIATANHAIAAMKEISADPAHDPELSNSWGEAHVLRAYLHFVLVNVFAEAYKDETQSAQDIALPYVTEPETTVSVDYGQQRLSVAAFYNKIEQDLLEGIDLIEDSRYKVPAYHFNHNAAHAFAARFYLYRRQYDKVIEHANEAIGVNPSASLRKWNLISNNTSDAMLNGLNDETQPCNFLLQSTYSLQDRMLTGCRHAINTGSTQDNIPSTKDIIYGSGPGWSGNLPVFRGRMFRPSAGSEFGSFHFKVIEYFEYTDKIAGIGFVHIIYQPFTAEETLLCRAEAKLYQGDRAGALQDLAAWTASKNVATALTQNLVNSFYRGDHTSNIYVSDLHPQQMSSEFKTLEGDDLSLLHCVLHFRRIETVFEGLRWFDIKRYGITVHHAYRGPRDYNITHDYLEWNDPRRVLQIPNNVVAAGYPSTDRTQTAPNVNDAMSNPPVRISE